MQYLITNTKGGCGKTTLAVCLAEVTNGVLLDHDPQGTLKLNAEITGRHKPQELEAIEQPALIFHDTPPYNNTTLHSLIPVVDRVIIPAKLMYADVLALTTLADLLSKANAFSKAVVVFNEVRHQNKKLNDEVKSIYKTEYPELYFASTEIPTWIGFSRVLAFPLPERERERIVQLWDELNAHKSLT